MMMAEPQQQLVSSSEAKPALAVPAGGEGGKIKTKTTTKLWHEQREVYKSVIADLMNMHRLTETGWTVVVGLGRATKNYYVCDFTKKQITLAKRLLAGNLSPEEVENALLLPIARVYVGPHADHAALTQQHNLLGGNSAVLQNFHMVKPPHVRYCPNGCEAEPVHKRSKITSKHAVCRHTLPNGRSCDAAMQYGDNNGTNYQATARDNWTRKQQKQLLLAEEMKGLTPEAVTPAAAAAMTFSPALAGPPAETLTAHSSRPMISRPRFSVREDAARVVCLRAMQVLQTANHDATTDIVLEWLRVLDRQHITQRVMEHTRIHSMCGLVAKHNHSHPAVKDMVRDLIKKWRSLLPDSLNHAVEMKRI